MNLRKVLSVFLAVVLMLGVFPTAVFADTEFTTTVESANAVVGNTFDVKVMLSNNPGIAAYKIMLEYDESLLTLNGVSYNTAVGGAGVPPQKMSSPVTLLWYAGTTDVSYNGVFATLSFTVSDKVLKDTATAISVSFDEDDITNTSQETVPMTTKDSTISIFLVRPGDINGDAKTNNKDLVCLAQYLALWDVKVNENTLDVNGDTKINNKDLVLLAQYLANWDVQIFPVVTPPVCSHENITAVDAVASTCVSTGNTAYWVCDDCGKCFSDAQAETEIAIASTVTAIDPNNHEHIVVDEAVPATKTSTGLTEGSHCDDCLKVLVAQEKVPMLKDEHSITYDISNGDSYIATQTIENLNPNTYTEGTGLTLRNISLPGFRFLGWYDGAGSNADQVKKIDATCTDDIELYAHWEKIEYSIQFKSDLLAVDDITYTVDTGRILPTPQLSNYVFVGWSDDSDNLYKSIPKGTTGNITLNANWTSERNKTWSKKQLGDPIIYEDTENNVIYFTYEIGEIQNVPVQVIKDFGYISGDGITKTETVTYTTQVSDSEMTSYTTAVAQATTESSEWQLSSGWSDKASLDTEIYKGTTEELEEIKSKSTSDTDTWNISNGRSGSSSTTVLSSNQYNLTNEAKINRTTTDAQKVSESVKESDSLTSTLKVEEKVGVSATATVENTATVSGSAGVPGNEVSASDSLKTGLSSTVSAETTVGASDTLSHETERAYAAESSYAVSNGSERGISVGNTNLNSTSATNTSSWNSESSYGASHTNTVSEETSHALAREISEKTGYGSEYIKSADQSSTQGTVSSEEHSEEYTSTVTHSKTVGETLTRTWTTQGTKPGYHRWVLASTAHVFAVVGYDIAKEAYFVSTYSIMDSETHDFEDYSYCDSHYGDNQNGVLPFEVPYEVMNYVSNRVSRSDGLQIDTETGVITSYTGTDNAVIIPEYWVVDEGDGTASVVEVTGFNSNVFRGNTEIKAVVLPDTVTVIPDRAFEGCTALMGVGAKNIEIIGNDAFAGCINFYGAYISNGVTSLGTNAFEKVYSLYVNAANSKVVQNSLLSGADNIVLYLDKLNDADNNNALHDETITTPETALMVAINGYGGNFNNTKIVSNSKSLIVNRANFSYDSGAPLQISSRNIEFNSVNATANGMVMFVNYDGPTIKLQGTNTMTTNGSNAVLLKNPNLSLLKDEIVGKVSTNGKVLYCGGISGADKIEGEIEQITPEQFDALLSSYTLYFNANGGTCSTASVTIPNGEALGELPVPTRDYYQFSGWYTSAEGGALVTSESVFTTMLDITLYAHWSPNEYSIAWDNCIGVEIDATLETSPIAGSECGTLHSGDTVHYGDIVSVSYSPSAAAYYISSNGSTQINVTGNITSSDIWASAGVHSYSVTWNQGDHTSIAVYRTSSPYAGASTGQLSYNSTVYYGDTLSINYGVETGYSLGHGIDSATVTSNIDGNSIYSYATVNGYTYYIYYYSTNGTYLGGSSACYNYGTTNTIYPVAISGYDTPGAQTVSWDSTTAKSIVFYYTPSAVSTSQSVASGNWFGRTWHTWQAYAEYTNRTSTTVDVRIKWVQTIKANYGYGYNTYFTPTIGGVQQSRTTISTGSQGCATSSTRTYTAYSSWQTVSVGTTNQTSVSISSKYSDSNGNNSSTGSWSATVAIPAY